MKFYVKEKWKKEIKPRTTSTSVIHFISTLHVSRFIQHFSDLNKCVCSQFSYVYRENFNIFSILNFQIEKKKNEIYNSIPFLFKWSAPMISRVSFGTNVRYKFQKGFDNCVSQWKEYLVHSNCFTPESSLLSLLFILCITKRKENKYRAL